MHEDFYEQAIIKYMVENHGHSYLYWLDMHHQTAIHQYVFLYHVL